MSSHSYDDTCPNCHKFLEVCHDTRPLDTISHTCVHCGLISFTKFEYMDLEELNGWREDFELELLKELPEQKEVY
jgi:hypothetical protein